MGQTEAQKRASKNYDLRNKDKRRYIGLKSSAKTFITNYSSLNDLRFLKNLLLEKELELELLEKEQAVLTDDVLDEDNNKSSLTLTEHQKEIIERFNNLIESDNLDIKDAGQKFKLIELYYTKYNIQKKTAQKHFNKIYLAHNKQE